MQQRIVGLLYGLKEKFIGTARCWAGLAAVLKGEIAIARSIEIDKPEGMEPFFKGILTERSSVPCRPSLSMTIC